MCELDANGIPEAGFDGSSRPGCLVNLFLSFRNILKCVEAQAPYASDQTGFSSIC